MTSTAPLATRLPSAPPPPTPRAGHAFDVVVTDLDRTFTGLDLSLDDQALAAARRLRQAGVAVVLATGRRVQDLAAWPVLHGAFDGFVVECGAVWGTWDDWRLTAAESSAVHAVARDLRADGCQIDEGAACCSVPAEWAARLDAHPLRPHLSVQPNRDRLDVVPAGVDKAAGLRRLLRHLRPDAGTAEWRILAVGDGENDLPVFAASTRAVAVANAAPVVLQAAHEVAPHPAAEGFVWATKKVLGEPS